MRICVIATALLVLIAEVVFIFDPTFHHWPAVLVCLWPMITLGWAYVAYTYWKLWRRNTS